MSKLECAETNFAQNLTLPGHQNLIILSFPPKKEHVHVSMQQSSVKIYPLVTKITQAMWTQTSTLMGPTQISMCHNEK